MFGDNEAVWKSSTIPHSSLKKRHNALSFHRVREAIAAKIVAFFKIDSKYNPADMLTKHLGHSSVKDFLSSLLFSRGRTKGECEDIG